MLVCRWLHIHIGTWNRLEQNQTLKTSCRVLFPAAHCWLGHPSASLPSSHRSSSYHDTRIKGEKPHWGWDTQRRLYKTYFQRGEINSGWFCWFIAGLFWDEGCARLVRSNESSPSPSFFCKWLMFFRRGISNLKIFLYLLGCSPCCWNGRCLSYSESLQYIKLVLCYTVPLFWDGRLRNPVLEAASLVSWLTNGAGEQGRAQVAAFSCPGLAVFIGSVISSMLPASLYA